MKQRLSIIAVVLLFASCAGKNEAPQLRTQQDTLSWAMGENIALSLQEMGDVLKLDNKTVQRAIEHTLAGKAQPIDDSTFRDAMQTMIFNQQVDAMRKANSTEAEVNRLQEQYFEQLTKEHPGVKRHESGFYYEVLKEGKGRKARFGDRVSFDYRSFLMLTNEPYDQTYGKREPIMHVVGRPMFQGLVEGLQLMNGGSIYRFYYPYQVAFGPNGSGNIPGYTPFIYEVELHEVFDE